MRGAENLENTPQNCKMIQDSGNRTSSTWLNSSMVMDRNMITNVGCYNMQTPPGLNQQRVTFELYPNSPLIRYYEDSFVTILTDDQVGGDEFRPLPLTPENYPASVIANDYSNSSHQTHAEEADMADITNTSDASNHVDDTDPDVDILPNDEPYSYLHGLNSDNLMQFSQQSAIQELMLKEHLDVKPNLDVLPTFEEHDIGGYKFNVKMGKVSKSRMNWVYSEKLNKIYIRMNEILAVDAVYTPKLPLQQLRIRVLMCIKNEVSEPVLRCQNHISKDNESHAKKRHAFLRCENPSAEYCGTAEGKSINDRYSILMPLGLCAMPKDDNSISQTIAIKFTCQNSCIGRKETSLIFLLEGMSGEILSQRVMDVKICSCPKRDNDADERNVKSTKRKACNDNNVREPKMKRECSKTPVKDERSSSDLEDSDSGLTLSKDFAVQPTPGGSYRLVMELSNKRLTQKVLEAVSQVVALELLEDPALATRNNKSYRKLKRLREQLQKH